MSSAHLLKVLDGLGKSGSLEVITVKNSFQESLAIPTLDKLEVSLLGKEKVFEGLYFLVELLAIIQPYP